MAQRATNRHFSFWLRLGQGQSERAEAPCQFRLSLSHSWLLYDLGSHLLRAHLVCSYPWQAKELLGQCCAVCCHLLRRYAIERGHLLTDKRDIGRFVARAAMGVRCQIGRIRLQHHAIAPQQWHKRMEFLGIGKGHWPAQTQHKVPTVGCFCHSHITTKGMENASKGMFGKRRL